MAADQYLIALAISCIGSFRGEAHIESQASSPCGLPGGVPWTERPDRSTPSAPVLQRVRVERRQLYLGVRHHLADNSFRDVVKSQNAAANGAGWSRSQRQLTARP